MSEKIASDPESSSLAFPALPTETEIYILPDGEIVVADLPMELAQMLVDLQLTGTIEVEFPS